VTRPQNPPLRRRRVNPYGGGYRKARQLLLAGRPDCWQGCGRPATEADHQPPLSRHLHVDGSGCCTLVPSCGPCQRQQAAELAMGLDLPPAPDPEPLSEPEGFSADDAVWDRPWLAELRDVPGNATWPRLMTVPHPRAVGSLGPDFVAWAEARTGGRFRWWQRLVATRLLEVDADGVLVWDAAFWSTARQVGKSWLLRELCFWRIHQAARFGEEQLVLHTGKDIAICREVQRPARIYAKARPEAYKVREVNGQEEVEYRGDGLASRWMVRSRGSVYGIAATLVAVDEGWKVSPEALEEGVVPTLVEGLQSQLMLVSTAHRAATTLMLRRRADALAALGSGTGDLLIEWSAPAGAELEDRAAWRQASPYWTARRERLIAVRVAAALAGGGDESDRDEADPVESVRAQWLNVWPGRITRPEKGEHLVDAAWWDRAGSDLDSVGPLVVGVADQYGRGCAVGFCGTLPDGRLVVGGQLVESRADAWDLAGRAAVVRPGSLLVTSPGLVDDPAVGELDMVEVHKATTADSAAALTLLRDMLATGQVVHDRSHELTVQVRSARVTVGVRLALIPAGRADLLLAVLWALRVAATRPAVEPAIY
jgi:hypothetical protein